MGKKLKITPHPSEIPTPFSPSKTFSQAEWKGIQIMKKHSKKEKEEKERMLREYGAFK